MPGPDLGTGRYPSKRDAGGTSVARPQAVARVTASLLGINPQRAKACREMPERRHPRTKAGRLPFVLGALARFEAYCPGPCRL